MCTLSWLRIVDGYELLFNRDEQRTRGAALPPRLFETPAARFLAPLDADAGGTWVGVNEHGLSLALLNGYGAGDGPGPFTSRGLLVRSLLEAESRSEVLLRLHDEPLQAFRSFSLFAIDEYGPAQVARWDREALEVEPAAELGLPLSSSSLDALGAGRLRRRLLAEWMAREAGLTSSLLERFHASHGEDRALAPCMHRAEASTVSLTHVRVTSQQVELSYRPGSPCQPSTATELALSRPEPAERV